MGAASATLAPLVALVEAHVLSAARLHADDTRAWLADVLARIADHPVQRLHDLLPWNWTPPRSLDAAPQPRRGGLTDAAIGREAHPEHLIRFPVP